MWSLRGAACLDEDVVEALKEIAFGRVNRGVELAYLEDPTAERIRKMDLSTVAEFKRGANGAVEIKFVDRVKALGALYEMLGGGDENEAAEFLQALEQENYMQRLAPLLGEERVQCGQVLALCGSSLRGAELWAVLVACGSVPGFRAE